MMWSGGMSIVGASTRMSCTPSSGSSAPVPSGHLEREGDEEERELIDTGRWLTTGPASGTLYSYIGSLADTSSESSVPGTLQAPCTSLMKPSKQTSQSRDRCDDEKTLQAQTKPRQLRTGGPVSGGPDGIIPGTKRDCRGLEQPVPKVAEEWPGMVDAPELDVNGEPVAGQRLLETDPVLKDGVDVEDLPSRRLRDRETVARVCSSGGTRQAVPEGARPEDGRFLYRKNWRELP
ncbi:hypothetical protein MRX96_032370 [Rhipicephalus microplus]